MRVVVYSEPFIPFSIILQFCYFRLWFHSSQTIVVIVILSIEKLSMDADTWVNTFQENIRIQELQLINF